MRRARTAGEQGTITLWMLGLCMVVLLIGGLSLDLWRAFSERRALASAADAAAVAGASALDESAYRRDGSVRLAPEEAERRAAASLSAQGDRRAMSGSRVDATEEEVEVVVSGTVEFSLLQLLSPGDSFEITVRATARPEAAP